MNRQAPFEFTGVWRAVPDMLQGDTGNFPREPNPEQEGTDMRVFLTREKLVAGKNTLSI